MPVNIVSTIALLCIRLSEYGALAQLGERVLCKHEVVGSIPTGSTTLRPSGYAWRGQGLNKLEYPRRSRRAKRGARRSHLANTGSGPSVINIRPRDNISHLLVLTGTTEDCVLSDIVKRRSIRVGSCNEGLPRKRSALRLCTDAFTISGSFRRKSRAVKLVTCCK